MASQNRWTTIARYPSELMGGSENVAGLPERAQLHHLGLARIHLKWRELAHKTAECRYAVKSRQYPAGANPARPMDRSAGSNQSDEGGNEFVEVLCVKVTLGDRANMQAETRVNAEQASKRIMRKPTCLLFREGRRRWTG